jgi:hypothetical protein
VTTTYCKRDIRSADLLAIILFGFGCVLAMMGTFVAFFPWQSAKDLAPKHGDSSATALGLAAAAAIFLMLGGALNLKVRQLVRHGGREPGEYEGVPE